MSVESSVQIENHVLQIFLFIFRPPVILTFAGFLPLSNKQYIRYHLPHMTGLFFHVLSIFVGIYATFSLREVPKFPLS